PKGFLWDVVNVGVGEEIWKSDLKWLCYPFHFKLRILLPYFYQPYYAECTLEDIIGNIQNFFEDFRNGSWISWQRVYVDPQNSYWGAMLISHDLYLSGFSREQLKRKNEMLAGDQFLGIKRKEFDWNTCDDECYENEYSDCIEAGGSEDECDEEALVTCCQYQEITETPGKALSYALFSAQDAPFKEIANAQGFADEMAVILDALITRLITETGGLLGLGHFAPSGGWTKENFEYPKADAEYKNKAIDTMNQRTYYDRKYANEIKKWKTKSLNVVNKIVSMLNYIKENCSDLMPKVDSKISYYETLRGNLDSTINQINEKFTQYEEIKTKIRNVSTYDEVDNLVEEGVNLFRDENRMPIYTQEEAGKAKDEYDRLKGEKDSISEIYNQCLNRTP
ncbi:hypothetical protein J7K44_01515, partial [bacterium]|nr:hypothetical protein [bacterium]